MRTLLENSVNISLPPSTHQRYCGRKDFTLITTGRNDRAPSTSSVKDLICSYSILLVAVSVCMHKYYFYVVKYVIQRLRIEP
jgi:hypothetical protein